MSKKILSVMLALVMVMSVFSIVSFAGVNSRYETFDEDTEAYAQKWSLETTNEADGNGKYTVNVVLETNYGVGAISLPLVVEGATLESAAEGTALFNADGYNADVRVDKTNNIVYIVPDPATEGSEAPVLATGSVVATLTFALTADTATVTLLNDAKTADNAGSLIAARPEDGLLACNTVFYGQLVMDADGNEIALGDEIASVTLGQEAAADPVELVIAEGSGVILNSSLTCAGAYDGALMGFAGTAFNNKTYFDASLSASNGGKLNYVAAPGSGRNRYGTGATVQLIDADGTTVLATYAVIIFGDVNGDGLINATDMSAILAHTGGTSVLATGTLAYYAASGADGSPRQINIVAGDRTAVSKHSNGQARLAQATIATKYASISC